MSSTGAVRHGSSYKLGIRVWEVKIWAHHVEMVTEDVELDEITQGELDNRINKSFLGTPSI